MKPYIIGGAGIYQMRISADAFDPIGGHPQHRIEIGQTAFGVNVGAGVSFPIVKRLKGFLEARYTQLSNPAVYPLVQDDLRFFHLMGGVAF